MQARVDPDKCQGHTLCAMRAPAIFELSEIDGHATALAGDLPDSEHAGVREAAGSCPEQAIVLS
ncbi:MAG: subB 1 [Pseudonocardiales bacterium]|jgi:ferredoxin|nr:subB 1 [Pseudonocardiales bacterium]